MIFHFNFKFMHIFWSFFLKLKWVPVKDWATFLLLVIQWPTTTLSLNCNFSQTVSLFQYVYFWSLPFATATTFMWRKTMLRKFLTGKKTNTMQWRFHSSHQGSFYKISREFCSFHDALFWTDRFEGSRNKVFVLVWC